MTERRVPRRGPGVLVVSAAAAIAFAAILAALVLQMRSGADPALRSSVTPVQPRVVLKRRIIDTKVIVTTDPPAVASPRAAPATVPSAAVSAAPQVSYAPVQTAPAPPPLPAPVTRTS